MVIDQQTSNTLKLIESILSWWRDHQFDVTGERGEHNAFDSEPEFVTQAKAMSSELGMRAKCRTCGHEIGAENSTSTCPECECMTWIHLHQ